MKPVPENRICSVARSLEILGDRWIFLILREAFFGVRHYDRFRLNLGIATNILSDRLKILVAHGILKRETDPEDARRVQYRFTEKGISIYPITLAFMEWGDRWLTEEAGPPLLLYHEKCGKRLKPVFCCAHCGEPVDARDVRYKKGPGTKSATDNRKKKKKKTMGF